MGLDVDNVNDQRMISLRRTRRTRRTRRLSQQAFADAPVLSAFISWGRPNAIKLSRSSRI
jgi:hypothetical protein